MTAVARNAGQTLPTRGIGLDTVPSPNGFMVFDGPVGRAVFADGAAPIQGVIWTQSHDLECLYEGPSKPESERDYPEDSYVCSEDCPGPHRNHDAFDVVPLLNLATLGGPHALGPILGWYTWAPGLAAAVDPEIEPDPWIRANDPQIEDHEIFTRTVLAGWVLMQQSISRVEPSAADRSERRRCARAGISPDVLVVRLRRIETATANDDEVVAVDWSHRWLVSGHWRQQYYPSESGHRPIWINPHVKGPQDRPLVLKEKVTAWVR
jgi:hypothetical protein